METERLVSITITIPKTRRDQLRQIVAQMNLENPDEVTSVSKFSREIFCECLEKLQNRGKGGPNR
jgi:hypothetical protein